MKQRFLISALIVAFGSNISVADEARYDTAINDIEISKKLSTQTIESIQLKAGTTGATDGSGIVVDTKPGGIKIVRSTTFNLVLCPATHPKLFDYSARCARGSVLNFTRYQPHLLRSNGQLYSPARVGASCTPIAGGDNTPASYILSCTK